MVRTPGDPGPPDFTTALHTNGAAKNGAWRGLNLENYWRTKRPGGREVPIPVDQRRLVDYAVARMMQALRFENPGINVRLPSHINPPFRAFQWTFDVYDGDSSPNLVGFIVFTTVTFGGNTVVPEGLRGVIASVDYWVEPDDNDGLLDMAQLPKLTMFKNSQAIPGFNAVGPGIARWESVTDIAGDETTGMVFPGPKIVSPVPLEPGDTIQFAVVHPVAVAAPPQYYFRLQGWLYPIEVEADGIVGTLADRGGGMVAMQ